MADDIPPLVERLDDRDQYGSEYPTSSMRTPAGWPTFNSPWGASASEVYAAAQQWPPANVASPNFAAVYPSQQPQTFSVIPPPSTAEPIPSGWGGFPAGPASAPALAPAPSNGAPGSAWTNGNAWTNQNSWTNQGQSRSQWVTNPSSWHAQPQTDHDDWVDVGVEQHDRPDWERHPSVAWPQGGLPTQSGRLAPRPLSRAASRSSYTSHHRARSVSHSTQSGYNNGSPGQGSQTAMLVWHEKTLEDEKRPPRAWRADFSMTKPSALVSALGKVGLGRQGSMRRRKTDAWLTVPHKVEMHPYLKFNGAIPNMSLDLRDNVCELWFRALDRRINAWDLTRFACEPPLPHIELWNPHFPWLIVAQSSNPAGVTLHDLFGAIWNCVQTPIGREDWHNHEMNQELRDKITKAFSVRVGEDQEERNLGVRRVDFLMERTLLVGFVKGKDPTQWEMKIKKYES